MKSKHSEFFAALQRAIAADHPDTVEPGLAKVYARRDYNRAWDKVRELQAQLDQGSSAEQLLLELSMP